jgi:hypothetical protein
VLSSLGAPHRLLRSNASSYRYVRYNVPGVESCRDAQYSFLSTYPVQPLFTPTMSSQ